MRHVHGADGPDVGSVQVTTPSPPVHTFVCRSHAPVGHAGLWQSTPGQFVPRESGTVQGSGVQGGTLAWAGDMPCRKGGSPRGREESRPLQGQAVWLKEVCGQQERVQRAGLAP